MSAREDAVAAFVNGGWSEQIAREIVASVRAEALAERDAQLIEWLSKKAAEFGSSNRAKAEAVALMADKLSRGAVRDDETGLSELASLRSENGRLRSEARQLQNDVTGACLARWEEEQENARLRLAWKSARERAEAYGQAIQRHVADRDTWKGWAKAAESEVAALRARVTELEAQLPATQEPENPFRPCGCPKRFDRHAWGCPTVPEDPHTSELHHDYALGRDLPEVTL